MHWVKSNFELGIVLEKSKWIKTKSVYSIDNGLVDRVRWLLPLSIKAHTSNLIQFKQTGLIFFKFLSLLKKNLHKILKYWFINDNLSAKS